MTAQGCGSLDAPVQRRNVQFTDSHIAFVANGDFNGDGRSDVAFLRDYGNGHVSLMTMTADANGDGGFAAPVVRWDAPYWGTGTRFVTAGDFNGDGKADIALFFDYGGGHVALFTLPASGSGGFGALSTRWNAPYWGTGTRFLTAGDFNGDGRSDLGLFFAYDTSHVALFTLTANGGGDGGFGTVTGIWDAPYWGSGTEQVTAGDLSGDGKAEIAMFYRYSGSSVAVFTMGADGNSAGPSAFWSDPAWGTGTRFMASGTYLGSGNGGAGISLFYDYGGGHVAVSTLYRSLSGQTQNPPAVQWDGPTWGSGTIAMR